MNISGGGLKAAYSFGFNHRIVKNGAGVGVFEDSFSAASNSIGNVPAQKMVFATDTNKIVLQNSESVFHVNEPVTCVAIYHWLNDPNTYSNQKTDAVLIGTKSSVTAYDVFNNKTLFHRDMPEGVNCIKVGTLDEYCLQEEGGGQEPIIICGCGTTIWGLKPDGSDVFWTALGDDINVLELCDMDGDGKNELLVGSNGIEIKVFKNASFWNEFDEGDPTMALCSLRTGTFAFGLSSGVVGVYSNGERHWRVKIDVRGVDSGEIRCKEQIEGDMVAAFLADINATGTPQLGLVFRNGQVHGIEFCKDEGTGDDSQKLMREYGQRKHNLLEELKNYERRESDEVSAVEKSSIPPNTNLECGLDLSLERGLCLHLSINNNVPIKAVLLFAEGIFESECYAIHPNGEIESSELSAYFCPAKDIIAELFIKVFAGFVMEKQMHVFEVNQVLPKFATFLHVDSLTVEPKGSYLEFKLVQPARPDQLSSWLTENFIFLEDLETIGEKLWDEHGDFLVKFVCTRNNEPLILEILSSGETTIKINDIESAGSILQSLAAHLNVKDLETRAFFPNSLLVVQNAINTMDEKYEINDRLSSDLSQRLNAVKECVVRAEDALAVRNAADSRKMYLRVAMLNRELVAQHTIRMTAREELLGSLKQLNLTIEQFSRLRVGPAASKLIQECRKAIADEDLATLPKLLQFGI